MKPTDFEIKAAQEVFELWFCVELGLDLDCNESEYIVRKMLTAAHIAVGDLTEEKLN